MPKLGRGSQPTPHDVPIPCRANGRNYESVTSLRTRRANPARFRSIRVARGLRCLSLLWERGGGAQYVGACRGTVWRRVGVRMGGVGGVRGKVPRGSEAEAFAWWRSGCLGWFLGVTGSWMSRPQAALRHHAGWVVEKKEKQDQWRQVDMPAAATVLAHSKIITCSNSRAGLALRPPLSHMGTSRSLIVGAVLKPAPTARTLGREAFA
jgi:hypothetical protein